MPRIIDCIQGSDEWLAQRCGVITASNFSKVFTGAGKASTQADALLHTLVAERMTGKPTETFKSDAMQRGNDLEPEARDMFELETGLSTELVGLIKMDDYEVGCSPDSLIGDDSGLEIKCPAPATHCQYLMDGTVPLKYIPQIMGCLWITGRQWWDFVSYHETMPALLVRVERDEEYIGKLADAVEKACKEIEAGVNAIRKMK